MALLLTSCLHCCQQRIFNQNINCFRRLESAFNQLFCLKFSFELVNFKELCNKTKLGVFLNTVHIYYRFVKQKFEILSISNSAYDIFTNCCWRRLVTSPRRQRARYLFLVACVCCYVCYHYSSTIKRLQLSLWCMTIYHHEPQRTRRDDNGLQRTTVDRNGLQRTAAYHNSNT